MWGDGEDIDVVLQFEGVVDVCVDQVGLYQFGIGIVCFVGVSDGEVQVLEVGVFQVDVQYWVVEGGVVVVEVVFDGYYVQGDFVEVEFVVDIVDYQVVVVVVGWLDCQVCVVVVGVVCL